MNVLKGIFFIFEKIVSYLIKSIKVFGKILFYLTGIAFFVFLIKRTKKKCNNEYSDTWSNV